MKASVVLLLVGSLSALNLKKAATWVELPNCPAGKPAVALALDLHNATWATCKTKTTPAPKEIGKDKFIWAAPIIPIAGETIKDHEH
jgi:hypothetical protein